MRVLAALWIAVVVTAACTEQHPDSRLNPTSEKGAPSGAFSPDAGSPQNGDVETARDAAGQSSVTCLRAPAKHRATGATCDHERDAVNLADSYVGAACHRDSDCDGGANGRCLPSFPGGPTCSYDECFGDPDCTQGSVCLCGEPNSVDNNRCGASNCRIDTDCPAPGFCSPSVGGCVNLGVQGYYCRTCDDECVDDADCKGLGARCRFDAAAAHWRCSTSQCAT